MTLTGTLRFRDLGAGAWVLEDPSGALHDLMVDAIPTARLQALEGSTVVIDGKAGGMGFGMASARSVTVRKISRG